MPTDMEIAKYNINMGGVGGGGGGVWGAYHTLASIFSFSFKIFLVNHRSANAPTPPSKHVPMGLLHNRAFQR